MRIASGLWTGLACVALWGSVAAAQDGTSALTAIRYAQQPTGSRLTLQFAGEVRYAVSRGSDRMIFSFPNTVLANSTGSRKLQFQDGLVRSVSPWSAGRDSIVVVVVLKAGTTSTLLRPSEGNALYIDVMKDPEAPALPARTVTVTAPSRRDKNASQPGLVDIPTLARTQVEEKRRTTDPVVQAPPTTAAVPSTTTAGARRSSDLAMIAAAVVLSVGSTLGLLLFLRRRAMKTLTPRPSQQIVGPVVPPAVPGMGIAADPVEAQVVEEPMFDDRVQIAKIFQRGKEEVNLAMALRARSLPRANKKRLEEIAHKSGSTSQRRTAARKLGVGVGEVELAVHLKNMQHKSKRKEGAK